MKKIWGFIALSVIGAAFLTVCVLHFFFRKSPRLTRMKLRLGAMLLAGTVITGTTACPPIMCYDPISPSIYIVSPVTKYATNTEVRLPVERMMIDSYSIKETKLLHEGNIPDAIIDVSLAPGSEADDKDHLVFNTLSTPGRYVLVISFGVKALDYEYDYETEITFDVIESE